MARARARHKAPPHAEGRRPQPVAAGLAIAPLAILLAVVTLLAYSGSFHAALSMDSPTLIERDTRLQVLSAESLHDIWTKNYWWPSRPSDLYRPVTTTSYLVNYAVLGNGPAPLGYHVINFLLHAFDAWLVYALVRRVTESAATAISAAALFATHPIATEAVTNVVGRADLFAAACVLGGLVLHIESRRRPNPWPWRLGLWATAFVGVFAKEAAVVVVPAVVLYDLWFPAAGRGGRPTLSGSTYLGLASVLGVLFLVRRAVLADMGFYRDHFLDNPLFGLSFVASRLTALRVMAKQLLLLIFPWRLSCDYSYDQIPLFSWAGPTEDAKTIAAALLVAALVAGALLVRKRQPVLSFFALLYFGALAPTSNLIFRIGSIMAERFLYLPLAAFAAVAALGLRAAASRLAPTPQKADRLAWSALGLVVLVLATRTYVRNADWQSEETLFRAAREAAPQSYKTHKGLANALLADDQPTVPRLDEAIAAAEAGLRIIDSRELPPADRPSDLMAALGLAYITKGDRLSGGRMAAEASPEATALYRKAVAVLENGLVTDRAVNVRVRELKARSGVPAAEIHDVGLRRVHGTLGNAYMRLGEYGKALESFAYLRHLDPGRADGYTQSAWALAKAGQAGEAVRMLIAAYILAEMPTIPPLLREVYQTIDAGVVPFRDNGALNVDDPHVRADVNGACAVLVSEHVRGDRTQAARDIRDLCVGRYGAPAAALATP
jgi:tetratricopeptide (TPR) repeat protein